MCSGRRCILPKPHCSPIARSRIRSRSHSSRPPWPRSCSSPALSGRNDGLALPSYLASRLYRMRVSTLFRGIHGAWSFSRRSPCSVSALYGRRLEIRVVWPANLCRRRSWCYSRPSCSDGWASKPDAEGCRRRLHRRDQDHPRTTRQTGVGFSDADPGTRARRVAARRGGRTARLLSPSQRRPRAARPDGEVSGHQSAAPVAGLGAAPRASHGAAD